MARVLAHWGPDDFAYLYASTLTGKVHLTQDEHTDFAPNVFLAHRRLAVTDLSTAGRQPMSNEAGDIFVVFNGAIHNYIELRAELKTAGHVFRTRTDTEIRLRVYVEWGMDLLKSVLSRQRKVGFTAPLAQPAAIEFSQ